MSLWIQTPVHTWCMVECPSQSPITHTIAGRLFLRYDSLLSSLLMWAKRTESEQQLWRLVGGFPLEAGGVETYRAVLTEDEEKRTFSHTAVAIKPSFLGLFQDKLSRPRRIRNNSRVRQTGSPC